MPPFMLEIDAARRAPLDQLAIDYLGRSDLGRSDLLIDLDFCRRLAGITEPDEVVARRLSVGVSAVRHWRKLGRRASMQPCR